MEVRFDDPKLERLEVEPKFSAGLSQALVRAFRKRMQQIRAAVDERDFYALRSLRFEKLKSDPRRRSMRLNDQYRLIIELQDKGRTKIVRIIGIEDYH